MVEKTRERSKDHVESLYAGKSTMTIIEQRLPTHVRQRTCGHALYLVHPTGEELDSRAC